MKLYRADNGITKFVTKLVDGSDRKYSGEPLRLDDRPTGILTVWNFNLTGRVPQRFSPRRRHQKIVAGHLLPGSASMNRREPRHEPDLTVRICRSPSERSLSKKNKSTQLGAGRLTENPTSSNQFVANAWVVYPIKSNAKLCC